MRSNTRDSVAYSVTRTIIPAVVMVVGCSVVAAHAQPIVVVDAPSSTVQPFTLSGAAGEPASSSGPAISTIHVYANPLNGGAATLIGTTSVGIYRPDMAVYGQQYWYSGWQIPVRGLPPGSYRRAQSRRTFSHQLGEMMKTFAAACWLTVHMFLPDDQGPVRLLGDPSVLEKDDSLLRFHGQLAAAARSRSVTELRPLLADEVVVGVETKLPRDEAIKTFGLSNPNQRWWRLLVGALDLTGGRDSWRSATASGR